MAAAGSVGIKGIDLPDIGSDGIKARGAGNHLGAHGTIGTIYGGRDAAKESRVVIGGRTEDITRFIEANIKETEVRKLRIGQSVDISVDAFPDLEIVGRVEAIGNSTTSEFALLPTPNPSGNFTKITQRLPVRIKVEQEKGLLRPGMMVEVNIDIRDQ